MYLFNFSAQLKKLSFKVPYKQQSIDSMQQWKMEELCNPFDGFYFACIF